MQIQLIDRNPKMVEAWREFFKSDFNVSIRQGEFTSAMTDVWVTPTNSAINMSGGVDLAVKNACSVPIQQRLQENAKGAFGGDLPVGRAVYTEAHKHTFPRYIIGVAVMDKEVSDLRRTVNTAKACAEVFQMLYTVQELENVESVAIPGLGAGTGQVSPRTCAELMKIGYVLFKRKRYATQGELVKALNEELDLAGYKCFYGFDTPGEMSGAVGCVRKNGHGMYPLPLTFNDSVWAPATLGKGYVSSIKDEGSASPEELLKGSVLEKSVPPAVPEDGDLSVLPVADLEQLANEVQEEKQKAAQYWGEMTIGTPLTF